MTYIPKEQIELLDNIVDNIIDRILDERFGKVTEWTVPQKKAASEATDRELKQFADWLTDKYFKANPESLVQVEVMPPKKKTRGVRRTKK